MAAYVFPSHRMKTWLPLNKPQFIVWDKIRVAAFISTLGVTTGALAGGFESREVIQHPALFEEAKEALAAAMIF